MSVEMISQWKNKKTARSQSRKEKEIKQPCQMYSRAARSGKTVNNTPKTN